MRIFWSLCLNAIRIPVFVRLEKIEHHLQTHETGILLLARTIVLIKLRHPSIPNSTPNRKTQTPNAIRWPVNFIYFRQLSPHNHLMPTLLFAWRIPSSLRTFGYSHVLNLYDNLTQQNPPNVTRLLDLPKIENMRSSRDVNRGLPHVFWRTLFISSVVVTLTGEG